MLKDLVELSRPKHWVKNIFVLMPLPFAIASGAEINLKILGMGLAAMCIAASSVYAFNDALDAERDRLHESKRKRPVASGRVSRGAAQSFATFLLLCSLGLAFQTGLGEALRILLAYAALNLLYCVIGKNIPLVDVFLLSSGFVLRVLLGCALLQVAPSNWLLLCSSALALFLALAKRHADLASGMDEQHRPSLAGYNEVFLSQAMGIMAGMSILAYALYCMEAEILKPGREFTSLPFVVIGVLDYLRIAQVHGVGGSPVDVLLGSRRIRAWGAGWAVAVLFSIGYL